MIILVTLSAFVASVLTLFSGFGLGTLLMPVVAIFLPIDIAIAITAFIHLLNNGFKLALVGARSERSSLLFFGVPAVAASFLGALTLASLSTSAGKIVFSIAGHTFATDAIRVTVGCVIILLLVVEIHPVLANLKFEKKHMPVGGILSGFFGGLSGHQGAFRSMFLIKSGLTKEQFIATGATIAVMVDFTRFSVYGFGKLNDLSLLPWRLVVPATIAAFIGSFVGSRLIGKTTIGSVQKIVTAMLVLIAIGMFFGII